MKKTEFVLSRRSLLKGSACGLVAMAGAALTSGRLYAADELPHLSEEDPQAVALKYKHDATKSERKDPKQFCNNCRYYKGKKGEQWGPCDLFPGKAVNKDGWCNVWALKS
jgi:hypothetical protein